MINHNDIPNEKDGLLKIFFMESTLKLDLEFAISINDVYKHLCLSRLIFLQSWLKDERRLSEPEMRKIPVIRMYFKGPNNELIFAIDPETGKRLILDRVTMEDRMKIIHSFFTAHEEYHEKWSEVLADFP